jgi:hypothetical protein
MRLAADGPATAAAGKERSADRGSYRRQSSTACDLLARRPRRALEHGRIEAPLSRARERPISTIVEPPRFPRACNSTIARAAPDSRNSCFVIPQTVVAWLAPCDVLFPGSTA